MQIFTTLNRILAHDPCNQRGPVEDGGWRKLLAGLGKTKADDEPLPYARIVEINGLDDALWACRAEPQYAKEWRLFAVWCARQVEGLMTDERSRRALHVAERYAHGMATNDELAAAWAAAMAVALAAEMDARDAPWAAAWAAAPTAAERAVAWAAERAARAAARAAERAVAWAAERAARAAQTRKFLEIVGG